MPSPTSSKLTLLPSLMVLLLLLLLLLLIQGQGGQCMKSLELEMEMDSEAHRRLLWEASSSNRRYISYDALRADVVPCSRQGVPYYNCRIMTTANPYTRGCESITSVWPGGHLRCKSWCPFFFFYLLAFAGSCAKLVAALQDLFWHTASQTRLRAASRQLSFPLNAYELLHVSFHLETFSNNTVTLSSKDWIGCSFFSMAFGHFKMANC
ncbi:hypothetical protein GUJ93_ZPchr0011g28818 [Zizania palustris]|uniref:Uncharacterized protein n=1 Tax=Zizania palustris TaxID=103762 RepID=A0A8J5WJ54_ZIZPA|nr:hypothetical protein GUJ93_ZPchr0011g28818 [Zizania palustris]